MGLKHAKKLGYKEASNENDATEEGGNSSDQENFIVENTVEPKTTQPKPTEATQPFQPIQPNQTPVETFQPIQPNRPNKSSQPNPTPNKDKSRSALAKKTLPRQ